MDISTCLFFLGMDLLVILPVVWYFMKRIQKLESEQAETKNQISKSIPASRRRR